MDISQFEFRKPLRYHWVNRYDKLDYREFNSIVLSVCEKHNIKKDNKTVQTLITMCFKSWMTESVCTVILDAARAAKLNKGIKKRAFKYSTESFRRVIKTLMDEGLADLAPGKHFKNRPDWSFSSYIYPTAKLIGMFKKEWSAFYETSTPGVLEIKISKDRREPVTEKQVSENPKLQERKKDLEGYNSFLSKSLFEFKGERYIYKWDKKKRVSTKETVIAKRRFIPFLSSVFSQDFDHGGRLYARKIGASPIYQALSKKERATILINNQKTKEVDFSCLHLNMLYALKGIQMEGDAYSFFPVRKLAKKAILVCLNSEDKETAVKALMYDRKSDSYTMKKKKAEEIIDAALQFHSAIAGFFFNNNRLGATLQYHDSDIMMAVLKKLQNKGITALPVHDSVIVQERHIEKAAKVMRWVYTKFMGVYIEVK